MPTSRSYGNMLKDKEVFKTVIKDKKPKESPWVVIGKKGKS